MRARLLRRQALSSVGASIAILVVVAVAAGLLTAWPRLARTTFQDEVDYRISTTAPAARSISGSESGTPVLSPGGTSSDDVRDTLDAVVAGAGDELRPLLGTPEALFSFDGPSPGISFEADTPRPSDLFDTVVRFRSIATLTDHVRIVDGEVAGAWEIPDDEVSDPEAEPATLPPIPVMLSTATAERLELDVGSVLSLTTVTMPVGAGFSDVQAVVTGLFEASDPDEEYWDHQVSGLQPLISTDPNRGDFATAAAYIDPRSAAELIYTGSVTARTEVWIPVDPGVTDPEALLDDLREVVARPVELDGPGGFGFGAEIALESALPDVLDDAISAQRSTSAVLTLVAAGPVGVTFALVALTTRLSVSRRRATLALASARGGSATQIRGALGLEGLLLGLPAAALGAGVATAVVPGDLTLGDYLLPLLVALAPAAFLAAEALPSLRSQRQDLSGRSANPYRRVIEVLTVGVAAGALYLLLSRGLQSTTTSAGVDPVATGAPLLLALATAVLATRVFPYPMRLVHAATRRRRDLAAFLGSARALREGVAGFVPMLALLVATSIAVFSTAMLTTLSTSVTTTAQARTGADVRLAGPPYQDDQIEQMSQIAGVGSIARVFSQASTDFTTTPDGALTGQSSRRITLYLVDTTELAQVQTAVPDAIALPEGMDELIDGAVPVVVSNEVAAGEDGTTTVQMNASVDVVAVGNAASAPGISEGSLWAIADLDLMREVTGQPLVPRMVLVGVTDGADIPAVTTALSDLVGGIGTIVAADTARTDYLASPSARSMQAGFVVALVLSVLQSVLALVLTLVLAAPARGRLVAVLRTLGVGARDSRRLVSWELVPLAAVAVVVGAGLGLALPQLVARTTDLSAFAGAASPPVVYDWARLAIVLGVVVVVIATTLAIASAIARRLSLSVLRIGDAT